jgi:hypothetical protein
MMTDITVKINGIEYRPSRGFGSQLNSYESGLKHGDTRVIAGELMYVYNLWPKRKWYSNKVDVGWQLYELKHQKEGIGYKNEGIGYINRFYKKVVGL